MKTNPSRRKFIAQLIAATLGLFSVAAQSAAHKTTTKSSQNLRKTNKVANENATKQSAAKQSAAKQNSAAISNKTPLANATNLPATSQMAGARLGINLAGIFDWNAELPFVDMFKMSRDWISQTNEGGWGSGAALEIDAHGWVKRLPANGYATTFVCSHDGGNHYPSGNYVILYDGEGEINVPYHTIKSAIAGKMIVNVDASKSAFRLDVTKTNPQNYIKNIRVIMPGFEKTYQDNPWHPDFLKRWSGIACIRYMDFMATNSSAQTRWDNRPQATDMTFANKGVSLELMIDLANRLNADPWFCMPHLADDDYIKQFASFVKANLHPNLRAWVEYSNEVWNGAFAQNAYASKQGQRLKFAEQPWEAAWKYNAYRSVQIFNIWQQVFGSTQRFVRVLASQAGNSGVAEQILSFQNAAKQADVLAIAPYFNFSVPPSAEDGITDKVVAAWSLDKLFAYLNKKSLLESSQWITDNKKIADRYTLKLVAYEAGQHLVGVTGAENNEQLTSLFLNANADARMGDLYEKHLVAWAEHDGDLTCMFNSVSPWSKWGSWGLQQYYNDKPPPKFKAVIDWAISRGQKMRL